MKRVVVLALAAVVALVAVGGAGNVFAYGQRVGALQQKWREEQAAGVPAARLDTLRAQLRADEARRGGSVPTALTTLPLFRDPLTGLEQQTQGIYDKVEAESRAQAQSALKALTDAYGPTPFDASAHKAKMETARTPADYQRLAKSWTAEATKVDRVKAQLSSRSGGMTGALPADIVSARDQLQQTTDKLTQAQMWTDPSSQTMASVKQYLGGSYQSMLARHDAMAASLQQTNATVGHRLDLKTQADDLVGSLPDLLQYGKDGDYQGRADQAKAAVAAARTDDALESSVGTLQGVVDELWSKKQAALQAMASGSTTCVGGLQGKYILLNISRQSLIACQDGNAVVQTLVTTGRPGMDTPTGSFTITAKLPMVHMTSLCAQGTDCWYPPADVYYAMRFYGQYYYLHSWPQSAYGPGTQDDPTVASHGCVHVPMGPIVQLYNWADVGTPVIITP